MTLVEHNPFHFDRARWQERHVLNLLKRLAINHHLGDRDRGFIRRHLDYATTIAQVGHQFERHPAPTEPRHGKGVQTKFQKFLNIGRV